MRTKVKASSQEEIQQRWKEHFKNLLRNPLEINDKPIKKIINSQLDIQLRQFTNEKTCYNNVGSMEDKRHYREMGKGCIFLFPKKGDLRIA